MTLEPNTHVSNRHKVNRQKLCYNVRMGPRSYSHVCLLSHPSTVPSQPLQQLACPRHGDGTLPYMANANSSLVVEMGFLTVEHSSGQQPFSRVFYAPPGATLWLHRSTPTGIFFETFWANSSGRFGRVLKHFFPKNIFSPLSLFIFSFIFSFLFHRVSSFLFHLPSLLFHRVSSFLFHLPSLLFHLLSSLFSCLVFHLLSYLCILVLSRLILSCLILSSFVSPLRSSLLSLFLSSFSVSLCLCLSVSVWCCGRVVLCCVVSCVVVCVRSGVWCGVCCGTVKTPCVHSKRALVYVQKRPRV